MTTSRPDRQPLVIFCCCVHYDIIPAAVKEQTLNSLLRTGLDAEVVDDLCGLTANRDPRLQSWVRTPSLAVVACFPRAIRWLFHAAGAPVPNGQVRFFNMRTQSAEQIVRELMKDNELLMIEEGTVPSASPINHQSSWIPWFPVIDYGRCQNCKQCLNFCLFGVYGLSPEGRVEVHKPSGCKTNCPACARMCPNQAIIFPKYGDAPINGDEVPRELIEDDGLLIEEGSASPIGRQSTSVPPAPAGDILDRIRQHAAGHRRFSTQPQEPSAARSCPTLDSLRKELGIPEEVLSSLSPADLARIQAKSQPGGPEKQRGGADDELGGRKKEHHG